jgi:NAD(P)-dependent dehydrogenase (short-subunit alcohol dehydrogenase family)
VRREASGKVALVTGGGAGIGRASALKFAAEGAAVAVADLNPDSASATAAMITDLGGTAAAFACDVSDEASVAQVIDDVVGLYGALDYAHNNAGLGHAQARLSDIEREGWDRVFAVNVTGTWLCMKYEIRHMLSAGGGAIVATSSASAALGFPLIAGYAASKAAINALVRTAANEYAADRIRVNSVMPGPIRTDMTDRAMRQNPALEQHLSEAVPMGRIGEADEVAEAVVWLCSDRSSFTTGATLTVDGGQLLR